jgi:hypothetical protein
MVTPKRVSSRAKPVVKYDSQSDDANNNSTPKKDKKRKSTTISNTPAKKMKKNKVPKEDKVPITLYKTPIKSTLKIAMGSYTPHTKNKLIYKNMVSNKSSVPERKRRQKLAYKILKAIYLKSKDLDAKTNEFKSYAILFKFFCDLSGKPSDKGKTWLEMGNNFDRFENDNELMYSYISNTTSQIEARITENTGLPSVKNINLTLEKLLIFVVLIWLDGVHDKYCKTSLISTIMNTDSFLNNPVPLFEPNIRNLIANKLQYGDIPVSIQRMIEYGIINRNKSYDNLFDYTTGGSLEVKVKYNVYQLFAEMWKGNPEPIIIDNAKQIYADSPIRINLAYDQGTGRVPEAFRAFKHMENNIVIENVLTMGGLVDPGRFMQDQKISYKGMFSGMFDVDNPRVQGKFAMDDIKFVFNLEGYGKILEMSCYPGKPVVSNPNDITENTDFMVLRINNFPITAGRTKNEGSISKFCGDFFQILYSITYNLSRKNSHNPVKKYVMASGDGMVVGIHAFMSLVMGDEFCFIFDTSSRNYKQGQQLYGLSKYIKVKSNINSPQITGNSNKMNTGNNKNNVVSKKLFVSKPSPRVPKTRPISFKKSVSTKPGSRPRTSKPSSSKKTPVVMVSVRKTPRPATAPASRKTPGRTPVNTIMVNASVRTTRSRSRSARK